ncbi:sensor histidine kinase [Sphingoaurantiacus capsulatus]|uniref:histidine kinase n=1 Tax=Sphingoaurantiacus capsulatus TaxID=1771310 RepID=A0ABV7XDY3_9SPHN
MRGRLGTRIVAAMVATAVLTAALFAIASFAVAYTVEDRIFADRLTAEVERQQAARRRVAPLSADMAVYEPGDALPRDLAGQFDWRAQQVEYYGAEGRHYHVKRFAYPGGQRAVLVSEVSQQLLVRPRREGIVTFLGLLTIGVMGVAALIGWQLGRRASAPLVRLAGEVEAAGGAVPRIDPACYPANEIGVLAEALAASYREIEAFVAREQAFTRDASHELRTPLAVIRTGAELAAAGGATAGPALARIGAAAQEMEQALDLLLALARGHAAATPADPVAVLPLLEKAVIDAAARYPDRRIEVVIEATPDQRAAAPPAVLALILGNLIGNVFQHADGSRLTLAATDGEIVIADDGPGLSGADAATRGSGLGLTIVRRLCDQHGIALAAGEGPGARFVLRF